jgi:predicted nuclease with TOPRIM domain
MSYIPDRKIMELSRQINEAREKFEKVAAERDALRDDLAAARALLMAARDQLEYWTPDESLVMENEQVQLNAYYALRDRIDSALAGEK